MRPLLASGLVVLILGHVSGCGRKRLDDPPESHDPYTTEASVEGAKKQPAQDSTKTPLKVRTTPPTRKATPSKNSSSSPIRIATNLDRWIEAVRIDQQKAVDDALEEWTQRVRALGFLVDDHKDTYEVAKRAYETAVEGREQFTEQQKKRRYLISARAELISTIEKLETIKKTPPSLDLSVPALDPTGVADGKIGRLLVGESKTPIFEVFQIVDSNSALLKWRGDIYWVEMSTRGLIDGKTITLDEGVVEAIGTKQYRTAIGSTNTVRAWKYHDDVFIPAPTLRIPTFPPHPLRADSLLRLEDIPMPQRDAVVPPRDTWASDWEMQGSVRARVKGLKVGPAVLVDEGGDRSDSPKPVFIVWIEIENVSKAEKRELQRWQAATTNCTMMNSSAESIERATFPAGRTLDNMEPYRRDLAPGTPTIEMLAFEIPKGAPRLTLTLNASRVGEKGSYQFSIPPQAWFK